MSGPISVDKTKTLSNRIVVFFPFRIESLLAVKAGAAFTFTGQNKTTFMHCSFLSAKLGIGTVHVLASGKHGFSSPKLIKISTGFDEFQVTSVYRFLNRSISLHAHDELSNTELCRMAIAQFLRLNDDVHTPVNADLEFTTAPYRGSLYARKRETAPAGETAFRAAGKDAAREAR